MGSAAERVWRATLIRVLFANATSEFGGAEQVVVSLAKRLPAHGVHVSFALLQPGPLEEILRSENIEVHTFPEKYRFRNVFSVIRCIRWLTMRLRADRAQILHSNLTAHLVGSWSARRAGIPELWHLHDYPFHFDRVHAINRRLPADCYLFTTEFLKSGEPSLARHRHAVIHPDCVDVEKLRAAPQTFQVLKQLDLQPAKYFLTVARFQEHKGHRYLIEAAAQLSERHPEIKWVLAGRATGKDQKGYLEELKEQIRARGLHGRVILPGFVADEDLAALFRGAISLVHPAITEGYGLVLLEAMAYGTPVIAAAASGPAEIIQDEKNGLLVPTRDADALGSAMERIIVDTQLAYRVREQASQDVDGRGVDAMVEQTAALYREILNAN